jgi:hypothetical protein
MVGWCDSNFFYSNSLRTVFMSQPSIFLSHDSKVILRIPGWWGAHSLLSGPPHPARGNAVPHHPRESLAHCTPNSSYFSSSRWYQLQTRTEVNSWGRGKFNLYLWYPQRGRRKYGREQSLCASHRVAHWCNHIVQRLYSLQVSMRLLTQGTEHRGCPKAF